MRGLLDPSRDVQHARQNVCPKNKNLQPCITEVAESLPDDEGQLPTAYFSFPGVV